MSNDFEIKGIDELTNQLDKMAKSADQLSKRKSVSFGELFTDSFMQKHSKFSSFEKFANAGGFDVSSSEAFEAIPDKEWNAWIATSSDLSDWKEMQQTAGLEFAKGQLGF